jgi:hypothetical protein
MLTKHTYLKVILTASCLFSAGLFAAEEGLEEDVMAEEGTAAEGPTKEQGKAVDEGGVKEAGTAEKAGTAAGEGGMAEEGMLEEEALEEAKPFYANSIELGIQYSTEDSFKFGEFTGMVDEGPYAIGNLFIHKRMPLEGGNTQYWDLVGTNLGLDSRSVLARYGVGGKYELFLDYDQKPHFNFEDAQSPFIGAGTAHQTLPATWDGTDNGFAGSCQGTDTGTTINKTCELNTATFHVLDFMKTYEVETQRYKLGGGFSLIPAQGWTLKADYHHEIKDGTETQGIVVASRNPTFIAITPIDYDTDEFDLRIARAGDKGQFELNYHLSLFNNDHQGLLYEDPFRLTAGATRTAIAINSPFGTPGQMGLPPDNMAQAFSFMGGYNLGQTTRATANLSYQRMTQDQTFLPYTVNPNVSGPRGFTCSGGGAYNPVTGCPAGQTKVADPLVPLVPLPRNSLDGVINNYFANLTLTGRPVPKLNLTGRYTFDLRDSDTPTDTYQTVRTDSVDQGFIDSDTARVNRDYRREMHKATLDAQYRLMPHATLDAGYQFEYVNRNLTERENTYEHTGKVRLMGSPTDTTNAWIRYLHAEKDGSTYDNRVAFLTGFSPEHVQEEIDACNTAGTPLLECEALYEEANNSHMRKFYLADRSRDQIAGNFSFFPNDKFTIGVTGRYTTDDFDAELGLTNRDVLSATLDLSYIPNDNLKTYAYYTHDYMNNKQLGCEQGGTSPDRCDPELGAPLPPRRMWEVQNKDLVNTVGAGFEWTNVIENKLDIVMDFSFSKAITEVDPKVDPINFPVLPVAPFPDITTKIYSLNLHGDYRLNKQTRLRFGYLYEYFNNNDWAMNNVDPTNIDILLNTGERSPNYTAHVFGLSLVYDFQ